MGLTIGVKIGRRPMERGTNRLADGIQIIHRIVSRGEQRVRRRVLADPRKAFLKAAPAVGHMASKEPPSGLLVVNQQVTRQPNAVENENQHNGAPGNFSYPT